MTGIDTSWLIDLEVGESPRHAGALALFDDWRFERTSVLAVYFQVFLEFQHVVTDPRRFSKPLAMSEALERCRFWAEQDRVRVVYPDDVSFKRGQLWLSAWKLGRNRLVDTHMAAAYAEAGVSRLLTANPRDFRIFDIFELPEY